MRLLGMTLDAVRGGVAGFSMITGNGVARRLMGDGVEAESLPGLSGSLGERCARRRGPMGDWGGLPEDRENLGLGSIPVVVQRQLGFVHALVCNNDDLRNKINFT
jgi:hypothetical protein